MEWQVLIVPGVALVLSIFLSGFVAVYNMRSNGLMAYYCKPKLGLITVKKEKKYVRKEPQKPGKTIRLDAFQSVNMDRIRWAVWLFFGGLAAIVVLFGAIAAAVVLKATTPAVGWILLAVALAIPLCFCASLILFLTVPAETGAAPYVWSAFSLQVVGFGCYVGANFMGEELLKGVVAAGGAMAHFISLIVFLVFLEQLGRFLRKEAIEKVAKIGTYSLAGSVVGALAVAAGGMLAKSGVLSVKPALGVVFGGLGLMGLGFAAGLVAVVMGLLALGAALEGLQRKKRRRRRQAVVEE
ncbi:MAG TPA: hypothetical protein EYP14_08995 [Planctomycetaceae bacterium]|nr:hypothetical protein [Planctomycetaceae bacterium]